MSCTSFRQAWRRALRIATLGIAALVSGCGGGEGGSGGDSGPRASLLRSPSEVIKPYVWFFSDFENTPAGFQAQLDYGDPLRVTTLLMQDWLARRDLATTAARIDQVVAKWRLDQPNPRLDYTFAYGRLPAGWWSGMDSWSFPMFLVGLWQETGVEVYRTLASRMIASASRDVAQGGVVWRGDEGCWFSEYAWPGMTEGDEFRVLNGHLYALQAIRMIASATGDAALDALYACGVRATKARSGQFAMGTDWLRYMLQPAVINQTHYVIFESMQFDALSRLDPDPFFAEQAALRRTLLARHFPVHLRTGPSGGRIFLSAVGAPHPYSLDTYDLSLDCTDGTITETHAISGLLDIERATASNVFIDAPTALNPATARCRVEADYVGKRHLLYEAPVVSSVADAAAGEGIAFALDATLDAYTTATGAITIDPTRRTTADGEAASYLDTQGRLVFTLPAALPWGAGELLALDFSADGALAIGIGVMSEGVEYFRYYPQTPGGHKVAVLLSPLGFDGGEHIRQIERLTVYVYTDRQPEAVHMEGARLRKLANPMQLFEYFRQEGPVFDVE